MNDKRDGVKRNENVDANEMNGTQLQELESSILFSMILF